MPSKLFRSTIATESRKEGFHKIRSYKKQNREFKAKDNAQDRMFQDILTEIEKLRNRIPDYDSGYLYIEENIEYDLNYNLDQIPTLINLFFCETDEPSEGKDPIYLMAPSNTPATEGVALKFLTGNKCKVYTGSTYVYGDKTEGYLRILFWR